MTDKNISHDRNAAGQPSPSHLHPRILVVDDDDVLRLLNTDVLAGSGYEVDAAANGEIAWNSLQLRNYDLLLTDHNMPKVTGLELLIKLRSAGMDMPVIIASGTVPSKELSNLHINATLHKPYTTQELLATVKKVLSATEDNDGQSLGA